MVERSEKLGALQIYRRP